MTMSALARVVGEYWGNGWGRLVVVVTLVSGMGMGFYHVGVEVEGVRQAVSRNTGHIEKLSRNIETMSNILWRKDDHELYDKGIRRELDDIKRGVERGQGRTHGS